jgi:hypothetical protein
MELSDRRDRFQDLRRLHRQPTARLRLRRRRLGARGRVEQLSA